jgi:hypothetical protein
MREIHGSGTPARGEERLCFPRFQGVAELCRYPPPNGNPLPEMRRDFAVWTMRGSGKTIWHDACRIDVGNTYAELTDDERQSFRDTWQGA